MILKLLLSLKFREKTKLQSFVSTNKNNYWYLLVTIGVFFLPKVSLNQFVLIKNNFSRYFWIFEYQQLLLLFYWSPKNGVLITNFIIKSSISIFGYFYVTMDTNSFSTPITIITPCLFSTFTNFIPRFLLIGADGKIEPKEIAKSIYSQV